MHFPVAREKESRRGKLGTLMLWYSQRLQLTNLVPQTIAALPQTIAFEELNPSLYI